MDFIAKINFSNNLLVMPNTQSDFVQYKYRVRSGNNKSVLLNAFKNRWWWSKAEKKQKINKMIWIVSVDFLHCLHFGIVSFDVIFLILLHRIEFN